MRSVAPANGPAVPTPASPSAVGPVPAYGFFRGPVMSKLRFVLPLLPLLLLLSGCPKQPTGNATVSGKVTYNNQPVTGGTVTFLASDGGTPYTGALSAEGTYDITQIPPGDYEVTVETESLKQQDQSQYGGQQGRGRGEQGLDKMSEEDKKKMKEGPGIQKPVTGTKYMKVPSKYALPNTSGLKATVNKGKNTGVDFTLTGEVEKEK